jgi:hypothetical protein
MCDHLIASDEGHYLTEEEDFEKKKKKEDFEKSFV